MANDYVVISRTNRTQLASQAIRLANLLREVRDLADAVNDAASHMHDGATFTAVETNFSLSSGAGGNFVTVLQQMQDALNTNATIAGQTRLDNFDGFVSRIAGQ